MLTLFWFVFWLGLTVLAFAAGVSLRVRLKDEAILETGRITTEEDEPTDRREVDEEERRFWSEEWDEPEEL